MDSAVEKFSAFDFLNLIIAGIVFLTTLGLCHYQQAKLLLLGLAGAIGESKFLLIIVILAILSISLVIGSIFQIIGHWIIKEKLGWEKKLIRTCLLNEKIFDNDFRINRIQSKARAYFELSNDEKFTKMQSEAFFHYCLYYLQVNGMDRKPEKLFETQGLSELLVCVFGATPLTSVLLYVIEARCFCEIGMDLHLVAVLYVLCFLLAFAFYYRYKISCINRIKMILSIYDARK